MIQLANLSFSKNSPNDSLVIINRINKIDPRSYYGNYFASIVYENLEETKKAIRYREILLSLDPWGTDNMLQLIRLHLLLGDRASADAIGDKIYNYFPNSQAQIDAMKLLSS